MCNIYIYNDFIDMSQRIPIFITIIHINTIIFYWYKFMITIIYLNKNEKSSCMCGKSKKKILVNLKKSNPFL